MMRLPLMLWSPKALTDHSQSENLGWGVFFGLMLMMFSYNVTFYFLTRERSYLLFSGAVLAYAFYLAALDGWTFELLWPDSPALNRLGVRLSGPVAVLSVLFFAIAFLGTRQHLPRIHRAFRILIPIYSAAALLPLLDTAKSFPVAFIRFWQCLRSCWCCWRGWLGGDKGIARSLVSCSRGSFFYVPESFLPCCRLAFCLRIHGPRAA